MKVVLVLIALIVCVSNFHAQTLIINEVSNGPSGSKEYIELVVVDTVTYNCGLTTPPCIDIRNWIIDDNSGYHSIGTTGTGVAPGCNRFSNDPLWSCVPLGTMILIYNNSDPNPNLPADDLSLNDGNCLIVAPINNTSLFESNSTTPGDVACSYPATGWTAGGNWNNIGMANGGDCARIVDLGGCEVFSLCWGNNDQNNLIYFAGSGTDDVWFFNDGDPEVQSNWTEGCASVADCGSDLQTPGAPNNTAHSTFIALYNNNCAPIDPIVASANPNNASCPCAGLGIASGSGSIAPYTYDWFDQSFTPLGISNDTATALCDGVYHVIVTSFIGCADTATITIANGSSSPSAGDGTSITLCSTAGAVDLFDYLLGTPDNGGTWSGPTTTSNGDQGTIVAAVAQAGTYIYSVGGAVGCPLDTAHINLTIDSPVEAGNDISITVCDVAGSVNLFDEITGNPDNNGTWSGPSALTNGHLGTFDPLSNVAGIYAYVVNGGTCPNDTSFMDVTIATTAIASIADFNLPLCYTEPSLFMTGSPLGGLWSASCGNCIDSISGEFYPDSSGIGTHQIYYTFSGACGDSDTSELTVEGDPSILIYPSYVDRCPNDTATLWMTGDNPVWFNGSADTSIVLADSGFFYATGSNSCGVDTAWAQIFWLDASICGEPFSWMKFPNIVTINGDGINDIFTIDEYWNISDLHVEIYNRWGQLQYDWDGIQGGWNGINPKGKKANDGTYYFIATALDWEEKIYVVKGAFMLIH